MRKHAAVTLFLPAYLQSLGYSEHHALIQLSERAIVKGDGYTISVPPWSTWRGMLEYLSCVERARAYLHEIDSQGPGFARPVDATYHSANIVFFAQALLDNVAMWLCDAFSLQQENGKPIANRDRLFAKRDRFCVHLARSIPACDLALERFRPYVARLDTYRRAWIHQLSGGAKIFSGSPGEKDFRPTFRVPLDPNIDLSSHDPTKLARIEACKAQNGGEWLQPMARFADEMADGCREFILALLEAILGPTTQAPPITSADKA